MEGLLLRIPLDVPPGLNSDDTALASSPAWADGSNVRFRLGKAQVIGGWESVTTDLLSGVCRAVLVWTDNAATLNIAFGTHSHLQLWQGGQLFDITPTSGFTAGAVDGTGTDGYGAGGYGVGGYGEPSVVDYYPLTWSLAPYGQTLMANPRGQTIFQWSNATGTPAAAVTNAPANVTYMLVARDFVFALGCNQEVGGAFNPLCIRHSGVRQATNWTTDSSSASTAREYILPGGGRIVAGREVGRSILVWTSHSLYLGTYVGQIGQVWRFDKVGDKCGLIGPNAAVIVGSTAFWISPDRQFHSYTVGGSVLPVACPIREDFADNLAYSQSDKIVASSCAQYSEVRFDYPDSRDGYENSRYIALCVEGPDAGSWHRGQMARTAMVDAGPSSYPCAVTYEGAVYWHERGKSADGAVIDWFIESADIYLDENMTVMARSFWPDIADQVGGVDLTLTTRMFPQGEGTVFGPHSMAAGLDKVDFKATGRLYRVKFSGSSAPTSARLGLGIFDVELRGRK